MKKTVSLFLASVLTLCCLFIGGCSSDKYTSSYNAVGLAQTNNDSSCSMSFSEFQGVKVFQINFKAGNSKSLIYKLSVEVGKATVYYDTNGEKKVLATVAPGQSIYSELEKLNCSSMYIIVETSDKCLNGNFSFEAKVL